MANVAKIQAELDLDSGKFHGSITSAIGKLKTFDATVDKTDRSLKNIERRVTGFGASLRDAMVVLGQFRAAMHTLWTFTGQWVGAIVQANAKMERLQVLMAGLSKSTTEVGRVTEALKDMNYVLEKSKNSPFSVDIIADSFVKLKASGIDPTKGSLDALTNAVARFGGNSETLHRATIAIQQMAGKGVVSMEEMRQQLGEAVPNAMQIMARSVNMSMAELVSTIASGRLAFDSVLQSKFFTEMNQEFGGAAEKMMTTWVGMTQKLKTEWMIFAKEIGDRGLFTQAKQGLSDLIDFMGSPDGKALAADIGKMLGDAAAAALRLIKYLIDNREEIVYWGKLLAQIFVVKKLMDFSSALVSTAATIRGFTGVLGNFSTAWRTAGTGMSGFAARLALLSGPIGVGIGLIGGLIWWLQRNAAAAREAGNAMQYYYDRTEAGESVTAKEHADMALKIERLKEIKRLAESAANLAPTDLAGRDAVDGKINTALGDLREMGVLQDGGNGFADWALKSWNEKIGILNEAVSASAWMHQTHVKQTLSQVNDYHEQNLQEYGTKLAGMIEKQGGDISQKLQANWEIINSGTPAEVEKAKAANDKLRQGKLDAQVEFLRGVKQRLIMEATIVRGNAEAYKKTVDYLRLTDQELSRVLEQRAAAGSDLKLMPKMGFGSEEKKNPLVTMLEQVAGRHAELQAKLEGGIPKLEKFNELLMMGKYGKNIDQGVVAQIRALLTANEELSASLAKNNATEKMSEELDEMASKASADVISAKMKASGKLYSQVSAGMVGFNRQVAVLRANLDKTNMSAEEFNAKVAEIKATLHEMEMINFNRFAQDTMFENWMATLPEKERRLAEFNNRLAQFEELRARMLENPNANKQAVNDQVDGMIASESARFRYENRNEWQKWIDDYIDITEEMDQVWAGSLDSMAGAMTDFLTTGKANWTDMATHILKEITRILMSKVVAELANMVIGLFGGGMGGTANATAANSGGAFVGPRAKGGAFNKGVEFFAKGGVVDKPTGFNTKTGFGVMGEAGPEAIMPLQRDGSGVLGLAMPEGMAGMGGTQIVNSVSIQVNVSQDGTATADTAATTKLGQELGRTIDSKIKQAFTEESRPGGILWRMKSGG